MQLTLWTYEGPPYIGAMRVATAMEGLHYVLHAPQGDTYADLAAQPELVLARKWNAISPSA